MLISSVCARVRLTQLEQEKELVIAKENKKKENS